jgi:hypothetical protein
MRYKEKISALALCALLCACTQTSTNVAKSAPINWSAEAGKRVVLVDPDVELSVLTAGGMTEARADWSQTGKNFIKTNIASAMQAKGVATIAADSITDRREAQLVKLHNALGQSILMNQMQAWPTKKDNFDWTLGPGVAALRDHYQGDYALFVFVRDSYTGAGRAAVMLAFAAFGVGLQGGQQLGFASLVDLRTGRIVWFNKLSSSAGSLKEEKPAAETVKHLLEGMPL